MPNRHKPIGNTEETLESRYEKTMARLQKIKDAGYTVVSAWGANLENNCATLLALKMNFACTPM
jgi:hypothetical protein